MKNGNKKSSPMVDQKVLVTQLHCFKQGFVMIILFYLMHKDLIVVMYLSTRMTSACCCQQSQGHFLKLILSNWLLPKNNLISTTYDLDALLYQVLLGAYCVVKIYTSKHISHLVFFSPAVYEIKKRNLKIYLINFYCEK